MSARVQRQPSTETLLAIAATAVRQGDRFAVKSSSGLKTYYTTAISCTCPHWQYRGTACVHMQAVSLLCPAPKPYTADAFAGFD